MKIGAWYSYLNGWEYLKVHKPDLWHQIEAVIASIDAEQCRTKKSGEQRRGGQELLFSPVDLNKAFRREFETRGWRP